MNAERDIMNSQIARILDHYTKQEVPSIAGLSRIAGAQHATQDVLFTHSLPQLTKRVHETSAKDIPPVQPVQSSTNKANRTAQQSTKYQEALPLAGKQQLRISSQTAVNSVVSEQSLASSQYQRVSQKDMLDEVLRKRLQKLETRLEVIQSQRDGAESEAHHHSEMSNQQKASVGDAGVRNRQQGMKHKSKGEDEIVSKKARLEAVSRFQKKSLDLDKLLTGFLGKQSCSVETMSDQMAGKILSAIESCCPEVANGARSSAAKPQAPNSDAPMLRELSEDLKAVFASNAEMSSEEFYDNGTNVNWQRPVADAELDTSMEAGQTDDVENDRDSMQSPESQHLGCLSVDTQWDSQFYESTVVKSTHMSSVRDWRSRKLLDLLISGRLKEIPMESSGSVVEHGPTDQLVANSLQSILGSLSWLWEVAVGSDSSNGVHNVLSDTSTEFSSTLNILMDHVENEGCVDIPVNVNVTASKPSCQSDPSESEPDNDVDTDDSLPTDATLLLIKELFLSLDDTREKFLATTDLSATGNDNDTVPLNEAESGNNETATDMYSPTRPTEMENTYSVEEATSVGRPSLPDDAVLAANAVRDTTGPVDTSVISRTVKVQKPETTVAKIDNARDIQSLSEVSNGRNAMSQSESVQQSSRVKPESFIGMQGLKHEDEMVAFSSDNTSEEKFSYDLEGDILQPQPQLSKQQASRDPKTSREFMEQVEGSSAVDVIKHSRRSADKHSVRSTRDKKERGRERREKRETHGKKQPPVDVRDDIKQLESSLDLLFEETFGIASQWKSLDADVPLNDQLNMLSDQAMAAGATLSRRNAVDAVFQHECSTSVLDKLLADLHIAIEPMHSSTPVLSTGEKVSVSMSRKKHIASAVVRRGSDGPASPPSVSSSQHQGSRARSSRRTSGSDVCIIPHSRTDAEITETKEQLEKANRLMQTFRRSQIAKRQNVKTGSRSNVADSQPLTTGRANAGTVKSAVVAPAAVMASTVVGSISDIPIPLGVGPTSSGMSAVASAGRKLDSSASAVNKEMRFFVFDTDDKSRQNIQEVLSARGACTFDPYNVVLLRAYNLLDCRVLTRSADIALMCRIPNFLRLKRDLRVMFVAYDSVDSVKHERVEWMCPRGGLVIMDMGTVIGCDTDVMERMCDFMLKQTSDKNSPWLMLIPGTTVAELQQLQLSVGANTADKYRRLSAILTKFKSDGIIQNLPENFGTRRRNSVDEFLRYFSELRSRYMFRHRHFLFVSGISRSHTNARGFLAHGIDVLTVPEFVRGFVGHVITSELHTPLEYSVRLTSARYVDALLSDAGESIMNKWTPPTVVC